MAPRIVPLEQTYDSGQTEERKINQYRGREAEEAAQAGDVYAIQEEQLELEMMAEHWFSKGARNAKDAINGLAEPLASKLKDYNLENSTAIIAAVLDFSEKFISIINLFYEGVLGHKQSVTRKEQTLPFSHNVQENTLRSKLNNILLKLESGDVSEEEQATLGQEYTTLRNQLIDISDKDTSFFEPEFPEDISKKDTATKSASVYKKALNPNSTLYGMHLRTVYTKLEQLLNKKDILDLVNYAGKSGIQLHQMQGLTKDIPRLDCLFLTELSRLMEDEDPQGLAGALNISSIVRAVNKIKHKRCSEIIREVKRSFTSTAVFKDMAQSIKSAYMNYAYWKYVDAELSRIAGAFHASARQDDQTLIALKFVRQASMDSILYHDFFKKGLSQVCPELYFVIFEHE